MIGVKKLALAALTALALAAAAVAATPAAHLAGDPSQWGVAKKGSFDITEVSADEVALMRGAPTLRIPPTCPDGSPEPCEDDELGRNINEYEAQITADAGDPSQWG